MKNSFTLPGGLTVNEFLRNYLQEEQTALVQGVNQYLTATAPLLKPFDFIPHTRPDELSG